MSGCVHAGSIICLWNTFERFSISALYYQKLVCLPRKFLFQLIFRVITKRLHTDPLSDNFELNSPTLLAFTHLAPNTLTSLARVKLHFGRLLIKPSAKQSSTSERLQRKSGNIYKHVVHDYFLPFSSRAVPVLIMATSKHTPTVSQ